MKTSLLTKFENVFNDLRAFLVAQIPERKPAQNQPVKIQEPKQPRKNSPQRTVAKKKGGRSSRAITSKQESMVDSQGMPKFSGSGYNGKGNVDHGKIRSNKKRR